MLPGGRDGPACRAVTPAAALADVSRLERQRAAVLATMYRLGDARLILRRRLSPAQWHGVSQRAFDEALDELVGRLESSRWTLDEAAQDLMAAVEATVGRVG